MLLVDFVDIKYRVGIADVALEHSYKCSRQLSAFPCARVHADQREFLRQYLGACEVVKRWRTTRRLVRSPPAPKITMAQGSASLGSRRGGAVTRCAFKRLEAGCSSSMALLRSLGRRCVRFASLSTLGSGSMGSAAFYVPAEAEAHGREHLLSKVCCFRERKRRRAPWRARLPGPLLDRGLETGPNDPRRNPGRSRRNPSAADPSPARRRRGSSSQDEITLPAPPNLCDIWHISRSARPRADPQSPCYAGYRKPSA